MDGLSATSNLKSEDSMKKSSKSNENEQDSLLPIPTVVIDDHNIDDVQHQGNNLDTRVSKVQQKLLYLFLGYGLFSILALSFLNVKITNTNKSLQKIVVSFEQREEKLLKDITEQLNKRDQESKKTLNDQLLALNKKWFNTINKQLQSRDEAFDKLKKELQQSNQNVGRIKSSLTKLISSFEPLEAELESVNKNINQKFFVVENILIRLQIKIDGLKVNQNDFINYFLILDHKLKERKVSLFPESENLPIAEKIQSTKNIYLAGKALYQSEEIVEQREAFNADEIIFFSKYYKSFPELKLRKYTLQTVNLNKTEQRLMLQSDYNFVAKKYNLSLYQTELPMCAILGGRNNNAGFRIEYNLNSIFLQNYTNYHAIVIDDFSDDGSQQIYSRYFEFYKIKTDKGTLILNEKRKYMMQNILTATFHHCKKNQIGVLIDADDELLGRNVFKQFNAYYSRRQYGLVFSKYFLILKKSHTIINLSDRHFYTQQDLENQLYRQSEAQISHTKTWRISLTYEIDLEDLKDQQGNYFMMTSDKAFFFPIAELSCGEVGQINEYNYVYNNETGVNDYEVDREYQYSLDVIIRQKKKYPCSKIYGSYKSRAEKNRAENYSMRN